MKKKTKLLAVGGIVEPKYVLGTETREEEIS